MFSKNISNNELEFTPTFGTQLNSAVKWEPGNMEAVLSIKKLLG